MEALGAAGSIIAVVDASVKIASSCLQYINAVKGAPDEIKHLQQGVTSTLVVLQDVKQLLDGPDGVHLRASQKLLGAVSDFKDQLSLIEKKLQPGKPRRFMGRFRSGKVLKWPFESKEIHGHLQSLSNGKNTINLALQVDNTVATVDIHRKIVQTIDLSKLPPAEGAAFDSYANEHDGKCHPNTRTDLLQLITAWAEDPQGACIFWLNGMAGTGKSTIARTIAEIFWDKGNLAASFFFKRGEGYRGGATRFFTTIAVQMMRKLPSLTPHIKKVVDADPEISQKSIAQQFEKLILLPLSKLDCNAAKVEKLVVVTDALDECEKEQDIRTILRLLAKAKDIQPVGLRIFVTSRPELPIRLGFGAMAGGVYRDLVLHEIPRSIIEHDISVFLKHELSMIKDNHNYSLGSPDSALPLEWPGEQNLQALVSMAIPLFIFGTTICRFIADQRFDPEKRLAVVLSYRTGNQELASRFDQTYRPVLDQLLAGLDDEEAEVVVADFQEVIGSIILLANPLSTAALANLLGISKREVDRRLNMMHSVLDIPSNPALPVRLLHLSFYDFLVDPKKRGNMSFWIDERKQHQKILTRCLELMSRPGTLCTNMCDLKSPGTKRAKIDSQTITDCVPSEVQYACYYWVHHLERSGSLICNGDQVHVFLEDKFLQWLEVLSLGGRITESIRMVTLLQGLLQSDASVRVSDFLHDASRFIRRNQWIIDVAPLQIYSSALVFAPENSVVKNKYKEQIPFWIRRQPEAVSDWGPVLQTLESKKTMRSMYGFVFSRHGTLLAWISEHDVIVIWDLATSQLLRKINSRNIEDFNMSILIPEVPRQCNFVLAAVYVCRTSTRTGEVSGYIKVWDIATGDLLHHLSVAYGNDKLYWGGLGTASLLASVSENGSLRLWDLKAGELLHQTEGHGQRVRDIKFSADGKLVAISCEGSTIKLCEPTSGEIIRTFDEQEKAVAFSSDGRLLATVSGSKSQTIRTWEITTGKTLHTLTSHTEKILSVVFARDNKLLASLSEDRTIKIWRHTIGEIINTIAIPKNLMVHTLTFCAGGMLLISGHGQTHLWDAITSKLQHSIHSQTSVSDDGEYLAVRHSSSSLQVWEVGTMATTKSQPPLRAYAGPFSLSGDGKYLAYQSPSGTAPIWDLTTGTQVFKLQEDHMRSVVTFSEDRKLLAIGYLKNGTQLKDLSTGEERKFKDILGARLLRFSNDGRFLAVLHSHEQNAWNLSICDLATNESRVFLTTREKPVTGLAFSEDNKLLAAYRTSSVELWDTAKAEIVWHHRPHEDMIESQGQPCYLPEVGLQRRGDTLTLAVINFQGPIGLWDFTINTKIQVIRHRWLSENFLRAGGDCSNIITSFGLFQLPLPWHTEPSSTQEVPLCKLVYRDDYWVAWNNENLLWIPPECRPPTNTLVPNISFGNNTFAWRCENEHVMVLGL